MRMLFLEGENIEVRSKEPGFIGSYYEAKVLQSFTTDSGDKRYVVEYKNLLKEDGSPERLTEVVSSDEIRPLPPKQPAGLSFQVGDFVDVFDNDGWWVGKITGEAGSDKCYVYFPTTADHIVYHVSSLRIHQDWFNGNWILSRKKMIHQDWCHGDWVLSKKKMQDSIQYLY